MSFLKCNQDNFLDFHTAISLTLYMFLSKICAIYAKRWKLNGSTPNFVWNKRTGMCNRSGVQGSGTGTVKQTARFVHTYWPIKCNGYGLAVGVFIF